MHAVRPQLAAATKRPVPRAMAPSSAEVWCIQVDSVGKPTKTSRGRTARVFARIDVAVDQVAAASWLVEA